MLSTGALGGNTSLRKGTRLLKSRGSRRHMQLLEVAQHEYYSAFFHMGVWRIRVFHHEPNSCWRVSTPSAHAHEPPPSSRSAGSDSRGTCFFTPRTQMATQTEIPKGEGVEEFNFILFLSTTVWQTKMIHCTISNLNASHDLKRNLMDWNDTWKWYYVTLKPLT